MMLALDNPSVDPGPKHVQNCSRAELRAKTALLGVAAEVPEKRGHSEFT